MRWKEGEYWLRDAVKYIKFPPDRRRVQQELYEHMISRNQDFLDEGFSEEAADLRVCQAMGDPEEVGKALAEVHKPFWGYFLRTLHILLALVILFAALTVVKGGGSGLFNNYHSLRVLREEIYGRVSEWIPQHATDALGDYRFRLVKAGLTEPEPAESARYFIEEGTCLILDLRTFTWDPNLGPPSFEFRALAVEDSRGKEYRAYALGEEDWIFFGSCLFYVRDFDQSAEWAVLRYEAGDRVLRLPVRLRGGSE